MRNPVTWIVALWLLSFVVLAVKTVPVSGDGIYYYAWLRSVAVDGDVEFANDLAPFRTNPHVARQLDSGVTTPRGLTPNLFSVGPALLWAPAWLPVHLLSGGNGFSYAEQLSISIATGLYGLAGLLLSYGFIRRVLLKPGAERRAARISAGAVGITLLGTNLGYYLTIETSLSHGLGFFTVSLLLYLWWRWRTALLAAARQHWWRWLFLGFVCGIAGSVRWQLLAVALIVPGVDVLIALGRRRSLSAARNAALVAVGAVVGFFPQLIGWRLLYGSWLAIPQGAGFFDWQSPHALDVLISNRHGLLTWTPIVAVALIGLLLAALRAVGARWTVALYALAILAVQVYVNGSLIEWWGGDAFGARRFTDVSTVVALGLALLLVAIRRRWLRLLMTALLVLLVVANVGLLQVFRLDLISRSEPVHIRDLLQLVQER